MLKKATYLVSAIMAVAMLWFNSAYCADDDHIWIRVEGTHFVTSPLANPPNQRFVPIGIMTRKMGRTEDFLRYCKIHGLNTVRFVFNTNNGGDDWDMDAEIARIAEWVAIAKQNQLYTVLDNHDFLGHANRPFWNANPYEYERWKVNYEKVAEAFKDEPWIMAYELMNEVFTRTLTREELRTHLGECGARVRAIDTKHIFIIPESESSGELPFWNDTFDASDFDPASPPQVAIAPHKYPAYRYWHQLDVFDAGRTKFNVPVYITEWSAGFGGNGYTYDRNKTWCKEFVDAANKYDMGWSILMYGAAQNYELPLLYTPDDPEIWQPVAREVFEKYPIPNNGIPAKVGIDHIPDWFDGMATNDTVELTIRIADSNGAMVQGSTAPLTVTITGPGSLQNVPSAAVNGKATVKVISTATPGTIEVTAASTGLTNAKITIPTAATWSNPQIASKNTTNMTLTGTVDVQHVAKGINAESVRYEYSTDGGNNWIYWDAAQSDEFSGSSLNAAKWTTVDHNTTGGTANVADGKLTIKSQGEDVWSTWVDTWAVTNISAKDEFTYVYERLTDEFEVVTKVTSQDNTNPWALAGILVRDSMVDTRYNGYAYLAVTPGNGFVFAWKDLGGMINGADRGATSNFKFIDARKTLGTTTYPCYLKLSKVRNPGFHEGDDAYNRRHYIFTGHYSTDGVNWTRIFSRNVYQTDITQNVGLFATSGVPGTFAEALFDFYRVQSYGSCTGNRLSMGKETATFGPVPYTASSTTKVRLKVLSVVPRTEYINNPGYEFVSEYDIVNGDVITQTGSYVGVGRRLTPALPPAGVYAYPNPHSFKTGTPITFAVSGIPQGQLQLYTLSGKLVRSYAISPEKKSIQWDGRNENGALAIKGMYVCRVTGRNGHAISNRLVILE